MTVSAAAGGSAQRCRRSRAKRLVDFTLALIALIVLSPLLLAVALLIRMRLGRPVLFRQPRLGLEARPFALIKFRSMRERHDASGQPLADELRLDPFGIWLRRLSLDELPQLWNVLRGELSLVGPRPMLVQYLPLFSPFQRRRLEVRPGITGWAQVNGRNRQSWTQRFADDVWYVDHWTFLLDLRILGKTLAVLGRLGDAAPADGTTMPAFQGGPPDEAA